MPDLAEQQAAFADLYADLLAQHLHPDPLAPLPPQTADLDEVLRQIAEAMATMYQPVDEVGLA